MTSQTRLLVKQQEVIETFKSSTCSHLMDTQELHQLSEQKFGAQEKRKTKYPIAR